MATKKKQIKVEYFTIPFEKYMEIVKQTNDYSAIVSKKLKEATSLEVAEWEESSIADFSEAFLLLYTYKEFLDDKINHPTEEEVEIATKQGIKDVLFSKDELTMMNGYYRAVELRLQDLSDKYNISFSLN